MAMRVIRKTKIENPCALIISDEKGNTKSFNMSSSWREKNYKKLMPIWTNHIHF